MSGIQDRISNYAETSNRGGEPIFRFEDGAARVARGLGWFSIGLGLAELISPALIGRITGARNHRGLIRAYGVREIAAGVGILSGKQTATWLWGRVAGDAMDLASLGNVMQSSGERSRKATLGAVAVAGVTALDIWCASQLSSRDLGSSEYNSHAEASMIVNRSPAECYSTWRNFESLPRFMSYIQSVRATGDRTWHWVGRTAEGGPRVEWDAELTEDNPNQRIAWRTLPGSDFRQSGSVEFEAAPGGRGTIVRASMDYAATGVALAAAAATLLGKHPEQMIRKQLRRFKQAVETGEVITTEGQSAGRRNSVTWLDRIAR